MNCKDIIDNLEAYIQNDLTEKEIAEIEKHLTECADCLNEYLQIKNTIIHIKNAYGKIEMPQKLSNFSLSSKSNKIKNYHFSIKKAAIAIACVFALLLGAVLVPNSLFTQKVSAGDYRKGFTLTALSYDSTGVNPDSEFLLESQKSITLSDLEANFSIDGEPNPIISENSSTSFKIKPSRQFEENRLYTFRLKSQDSADITWTFQTSAAFKILGSFPADKTTDVPTNSGIEIYFSHEEFEDVDKYFEISPQVEGRFERHKKAVVFVPKELKESTVYTIKIKKGLKLNGTEYALGEDFEFQFETTSNSGKNYPMSISYSQTVSEYPTKYSPILPIYCNSFSGSIKELLEVKTSVYAYNNIDSFIQALEDRYSSEELSWAYRSYSENHAPVDKLNKVAEFQQEIDPKSDNKYIKLPQPLPQGFYLVDSQWKEYKFQTFIQVTDIGIYATSSSDKTLLWLNDLNSKSPIYNARISVIGSNIVYNTDKEGIAYFDNPKLDNKKNRIYFKIQTDDNKQAVLSIGLNDTNQDENINMYWSFVQLDRNLYKPDDTVNFWGLVKNRYSKEKIDSLVVQIDEVYDYIQRYFDYRLEGKGIIGYYPMNEPPLVSQEVYVKDGVFSGNLQLPNLDPGGYQLTVKKGNKIVASSYILIENYIKPAFELNISKDKEAVFPGEEINFNINGAFFEGTGVADLEINYNIYDPTSYAENFKNTATTDFSGSTSVKYTPNVDKYLQGEQYIHFYAHAAKPEIGEISGNTDVRLFVNDIDVKLESELINQKGVITANVNKIVLDRLNNGTAKDSNDYLGDPVKGKNLKGTIYKHTWEKIEDGEYYDYVNKVIQKKYKFKKKKEVFGQISMTTDADGKATASFDVLSIENEYYTAEITCTDNSGRNMKFECYFGDYSHYNFYEYDRYFLHGGKEKYKINEKVDLIFKKGYDTLPDGKYLFIKSQNGIKDFEISTKPNYSFIMEDKYLPNVHVTGVYFNGLTYKQSDEYNVVFDHEEKNLVIDASLDKDSYKPGDEVTVKISAKDKKGNPTKAFINISIVDEALFKLNEDYFELLHTLYSGLPSGIDYNYISHVNSDFYGIRSEYTVVTDTLISAPSRKIMIEFSESLATSSSSNLKTRSDFRDTAYFNTIALNDDGYGEVTFKVPDNITSWRVTLSGVTADLLAGSNTVNLNVSLPFFINYSLNSTYLVGDKPVLGVTAYGKDLQKNEKVFFEVYDAQSQKLIASGEGKAFARVNIPLPELSEGKKEIIIRASTSTGLSDSLKHSFNVIKTYHEIEEALYYDLTPGLKFEGGTKGNTKLIFTDKGKGMYLDELNRLMYTYGNRIDQKLTAQKAAELIKDHFELMDIENIVQFNASDYQREDGGIAILPYGNSDLDISAKLSSLLKDKVNAFRLKEYFYTKLYDDSPGLKGNALYGLAVLKEPVLLDLDKAAEVKNATIKDLLYIALAYCELGELPKADSIFVEKIAPHIKGFKPYYRIDTGKDKDDILECTALAAVLASKLDKPHKSGFYKYCTENNSENITTSIEKLMYIEEEITKADNGPTSFSYTLNGKQYTQSLDNGKTFTLTIPSENLKNLNITDVKGDISLVSMFKKPLTSAVKTDNSLTVTKSYINTKGNQATTNFSQSDIVKVVITWNVGAKALDGTYQITDYLPSGLKPIDDPRSMGVDLNSNEINYMESDGQKVTFYVNKDQKKKTLTYYARVISPGTYKAESTIIQSVSSKESMNMSETYTIEIN